MLFHEFKHVKCCTCHTHELLQRIQRDVEFLIFWPTTFIIQVHLMLGIHEEGDHYYLLHLKLLLTQQKIGIIHGIAFFTLHNDNFVVFIFAFDDYALLLITTTCPNSSIVILFILAHYQT